MIPVKTLPRFKCDFCKKRSTKGIIEKHEKRCFRNPNRFCDKCRNTGKVTIDRFSAVYATEIGMEEPCPYCSKFDKNVLKEIEDREKGIYTHSKEI